MKSAIAKRDLIYLSAAFLVLLVSLFLTNPITLFIGDTLYLIGYSTIGIIIALVLMVVVIIRRARAIR